MILKEDYCNSDDGVYLVYCSENEIGFQTDTYFVVYYKNEDGYVCDICMSHEESDHVITIDKQIFKVRYAELSLTVQEYITGHLVEWKEKLMKIEDFLLKPPLYEIDSWQTYDISFYNGKCFRAEIHPGKTIIYMKNTYGNEYYQDFNEEYHINQIVDYIKGREGIQQFKLDL